MNLKQVIENECGEDYMAMIRNGESPSELARESGFRDCAVCGDWVDCDDDGTTSGQNDDDVCYGRIISKKNFRGTNKQLVESARAFQKREAV